MQENILFSIIVPVYKIEEYLPACIDSLLAQTYSNIEIILVDDGSPDSCPKICDDYAAADPRIRVIHKKNAGVTAARKTGVETAKGDYICCVDGDDYIAENYIEKMAEQAVLYNPDMICCGYFIAEPDKNTPKPLPNRLGFYQRQDIEKEIMPQLIQTPAATYFTPSLWAKAIRTDIFKVQQAKINNSLKMGEDGACIIPCVYSSESLALIPECLYFYRYNPSSITKNGKAFNWDGPELIAAHLKNELDLKQFDFKEQFDRKIVHELFTVVKSQFNRQEKYSVIAKDIKKNLQNPVYSDAIKKCNFNSLSGKLAHFSLKYRLLWLIWLFNAIK